jgi:beta-lactam-binding protein with PASTA domain
LVIGNGAGPSEVDIPELVNLTLNDAKFAIHGANLTVGTITFQGAITDTNSAVVVAISPMKTDSVSKVSVGTRINLTVTQTRKD